MNSFKNKISYDISKVTPLVIERSNLSLTTRSELYVGNFNVLKHVAAVGSRSELRRIWTLWIVKRGCKLANPKRGARSHDVTKRKNAFC